MYNCQYLYNNPQQAHITAQFTSSTLIILPKNNLLTSLLPHPALQQTACPHNVWENSRTDQKIINSDFMKQLCPLIPNFRRDETFISASCFTDNNLFLFILPFTPIPH